MIFKKLGSISLLPGLLPALLLAMLLPAAALAAPSTKDADFHIMGVFDAYRMGNPIKLASHAQKLEGHVLTPWIEYMRLSLKLEDAQNAEVALRIELQRPPSSYGPTLTTEFQRHDVFSIAHIQPCAGE